MKCKCGHHQVMHSRVGCWVVPGVGAYCDCLGFRERVQETADAQRELRKNDDNRNRTGEGYTEDGY